MGQEILQFQYKSNNYLQNVKKKDLPIYLPSYIWHSYKKKKKKREKISVNF